MLKCMWKEKFFQKINLKLQGHQVTNIGSAAGLALIFLLVDYF